jgi:capsular exopolysaccharide synthesis family protein
MEEAAVGLRDTARVTELPTEEVLLPSESRLVYHTDPRSRAADQFRLLRMHLYELSTTRKVKKLLITSPLAGDGKSTIAMNLGTALSERGKRTVLVLEADFHHSSLTDDLGLHPGPGLAQCLEDGLNPIRALRHLKPLGWYLLPAGRVSGDPTELLRTEMIRVVIAQLNDVFDWILIDCPPVLPVTDSLSLKELSDAGLLIARAGRTSQEAIEKALALLGKQYVLGIVLNGSEGRDRVHGEYQYSRYHPGEART